MRRNERFPAGSYKILNGFVIFISLPALVLYHIHELRWQSEMIFSALMPWILFLLSWVFFEILYKMGHLSRSVSRCLTITAGLGNTSFVGLPLIEAYYGPGELGTGILIDQLGTFLCLGTLGIVFIFYAKEGKFAPRQMGKLLLGFPPSIALLLAFLLRPWPYPEFLIEILSRLGDTLTPIALVSVGLQMNFKSLSGRIKSMGLGLFFKLILAPGILSLLYWNIFSLRGNLFSVTIFEASMAPMVTATILAIENDLEPELAGLMLGFGIPISLVSTYFVFQILSVWSLTNLDISYIKWEKFL